MTRATRFEIRDRVVSLTFSPDCRHIAVRSSGYSGTLELFDIATGARVWRRCRARYGQIAFSADGALLVGVTWTRAFILAAADGRVVQKVRIPPRGEEIHDVRISADGTRLAAANKKTVRVYDVPTGIKVLGFRLSADCYAMRYSPNGALIATLEKTALLTDPWVGSAGQDGAVAAEAEHG